MDLKTFVDQVTRGQYDDREKTRKMNEFIRNYEVSLRKKKLLKKLNLKNGVETRHDEPEPEYMDGHAQTEVHESKIMDFDLRDLWTKVNEARVERESRMTSLNAMFRKVDVLMQRVERFTGTYQLVWRVRNFSQVLQDARDGTKLVVQSPVFDSHRNGYKMQISICPNGEGKAKNIFMSLFFSILKGTSDSLLPWPFNCSITFTLLNQKLIKQPQRQHQQRQQSGLHGSTSVSTLEKDGDKNNKIHISPPAPSSSSSSSNFVEGELRDHSLVFHSNSHPSNENFLQRPIEDRNKSLGFPKFILLEDLLDGGYVEEDNIYIRVYVDISKI